MTRRERGDRPLADQLLREGRTDRRPNPLLVVWWWRWELGLVATVAVLGHVVAVDLLLTVATVVALGALVPAVRRAVRDLFWCVVTQHRLRAGLRESDVRSWSGRMPAILWTSATGDGERVLLTCPAGVDAARISAARGELAAACWAAAVHVVPHARYGGVAAVEVVRRGPGRETS